MNKNLLLIFIFLINLSCSNDDQPFVNVITKNGVDYLQSHENWRQLKSEKGDSYYYQISFLS